MGNYLNPDNSKFQRAVNSDIYVDKTGLIKYTNRVINTMQAYVCVSRPRRFGKSMAADMLTAYYSRGCDSRELFAGLEIAEDKNFTRYLNKYDTIFLNVQEFLSRSSNVQELLTRIKQRVIRELARLYPDVELFDPEDLAETMQDIYAESKCPFILIIDEWDCIFREFKNDKEAQEKYLDFLRDLIKDKSYIHLAYMTGILPIKKYGTHSALNMFDEFSMIDPGPLASYVGFTEAEVKKLCEEYHMELSEIRNWYDGYSFEEVSSVYSPKSVVSCMRLGKLGNYWNQTETFEALQIYIDMNFEGLRDDILSMLAGEEVPVNTGSFTNDMTTFRTEDDVLTLLIHLGYLGYHYSARSVFIPNDEIRAEYVNAVSVSDWGEVSKALKNSVFHGMKSYFCQNEFGQIAPVYSISAGLDYPGIGPEHAYLHDIGRAQYVPVTDDQAVDAFEYIARTEGIICAIESAHAVAYAMELAPKMDKDQIMIVNLSGRGDKDVAAIARYRGIDLHE